MGLIWKTGQWILLSFEVISCGLVVAELSQGDFVVKVMVAHFHHKHSLRYQQWLRVRGVLLTAAKSSSSRQHCKQGRWKSRR